MTAVDSESMGKRIADARTRTGMTQAGLAAAIGIDRSALAKIENGTRRVSALELARIAEATRERIEWFVLQVPEAIVSHRNMQDPGAESPVIDRIVETFAWNTEFLLKHDDRLRLESPGPLAKPGTNDEAERTAREARKLMGLGPSEPLLNIVEAVAKIGLFTLSRDLGPDAADAASVLLARGGVAVINGHLLVGRRRLALAHELGHYLFADEYTVDWRIAEKDDDNAWESRLDRFARAVLLPADGLTEAWHTARKDGDLRTTAVKVASKFRVDMSTLSRRLVETGVLGTHDAASVRSVRTTKADIIELNLVTRDELAATSLSLEYQQAVLRLYKQEVISPARATELLYDTLNEDDLPPLPPLPESAIWDFT
ncbi:XRE family transcriptional regulator [Lentzea jiangxiensis]|nr:XRE family transcriptional regulator [Lentzea jiangxiensis]